MLSYLTELTEMTGLSFLALNNGMVCTALNALNNFQNMQSQKKLRKKICGKSVHKKNWRKKFVTRVFTKKIGGKNLWQECSQKNLRKKKCAYKKNHW